MATNYTSLYADIRAACGDWGDTQGGSSVVSSTYIFRDDMIKNALNLVLLDIADYSGDGSVITPTLSDDNDKLLVVLSTALLLLVGLTDQMYATRDEKFSKKIPTNQLELVAAMLAKAKSLNKLPVASDGSTAAIINVGIRWSNQLSTIVES